MRLAWDAGRRQRRIGHPRIIGRSPSDCPACVPGRHAFTSEDAKNPGDDLFSRKAALSVSSALESLTAVFGMGTGVASPLESPGFFCDEDVTRPRRDGTHKRPSGPRIDDRIFDLCRDRSFDRTTRWDPRIPAAAIGSAAKEVKPSTISTAQLRRLPDFHMPPIKQVVSLRSYPVDPVGNLILRRASHLDAFSAYPNRT